MIIRKQTNEQGQTQFVEVAAQENGPPFLTIVMGAPKASLRAGAWSGENVLRTQVTPQDLHDMAALFEAMADELEQAQTDILAPLVDAYLALSTEQRTALRQRLQAAG